MGLATKLLSNKWFWIGLGILILIIIIHRQWSSIKQAAKNTIKQQDINFEQGETVVINQTRKKQLEKAASDIKNDIDDTPIITSRDWAAYGVAKNATDNELKYMAKYYKDSLTNGVSMYSDLDSEYYIDNRSLIDDLKNRLSKMGLQ